MTQLPAAVENLVADGRMLEALDMFEEFAREVADPNIDRRLVELRHDAFESVSREPGRPDWPPLYPDPFPNESGIPEISADELSAETIGGGLVHHGCLRVNGLAASDQVTWFRDCIDAAFEGRERRLEDAEADISQSGFVPFSVGKVKAEGFGSGAFVRAADVPTAMRRLVDLFADSGLRSAVTGYLGERPAMIANKWVLRRSPSGKQGTDYHQDGAFLGADIRTIDCWIALSDCGPGTGLPAMDLVPRRFDVLEPDPEAVFDWAQSEAAVMAVMPDAAVASPVFAAGDALLFDERLPHRTSVGLELTTRYAVESWFVAPSSYPDRHVPFVL